MASYAAYLARRAAQDAEMDRRARAGEYTLAQLIDACDRGRIHDRVFRRLLPLLPTTTDWIAEHADDPDAEGATLVYAGPLEQLDGALVENALEVEPGNLAVELSLPDWPPVHLLGVHPDQLLWMPNHHPIR